MASVTADRSILSFSTGGGAVDCTDGGTILLTCCDVVGNVGGNWTGCIAGQFGVNGNFTAPPMFCDADGGDFTLHADSPCAAENSPQCGQIGAWPVGCGESPTPLLETTWGGIKALFRAPAFDSERAGAAAPR